jgi:predicted dehydrogenase
LNNSSKQIKVLIVGLGNIGMGYDLELPTQEYIFTHAKAFLSHNYFNLVGGVDKKETKRKIFEKIYNLPAFNNIEKAINKTSPELVVVSTSTDSICKLINELVEVHKIKIILAEKPLSYDFNIAKKTVELCKQKNCQLFINYLRRSDIGVIKIKNNITDNLLNPPLKGNVWYSKGLYNSASHFINLLQYFWGEIHSYRLINTNKVSHKKHKINFQNDPNVDFELKFINTKIIFQSLDSNNFFYNSVEMIGENYKLNYDFGGEDISVNNLSSFELLQNYRTLSKKRQTYSGNYNKMQWQVVNQLSEYFKGNKFHLCSGIEALETLKVINGIRNSK